MMSADDRQELKRMRDQLADRMHHYDEQVSYGVMSFEEKHHRLAHEFGTDYHETLTSINQMLHEKPGTHRVVPHAHLPFLTLVILAGLGVALLLSVVSPSLTGQAVHAHIELTQNNPVRLSWSVDRELLGVNAVYSGSDDAVLMLSDARGEHTLIVVEQGVVSCVGCGMVAQVPVLLELVEGSGTLTISSMTTRQKP